jgi:hypothetical protein
MMRRNWPIDSMSYWRIRRDPRHSACADRRSFVIDTPGKQRPKGWRFTSNAASGRMRASANLRASTRAAGFCLARRGR